MSFDAKRLYTLPMADVNSFLSQEKMRFCFQN